MPQHEAWHCSVCASMHWPHWDWQHALYLMWSEILIAMLCEAVIQQRGLVNEATRLVEEATMALRNMR